MERDIQQTKITAKEIAAEEKEERLSSKTKYVSQHIKLFPKV
jgi:hypothetical protein